MADARQLQFASQLSLGHQGPEHNCSVLHCVLLPHLSATTLRQTKILLLLLPWSSPMQASHLSCAL